MDVYPFHRVFVTGGAGFIGSHIVDQLAQEEGSSDCEEITVLDDLSTGHLSNLKMLAEKSSSQPNNGLKFEKGSINDYETVRKALEDVDVVFHEASIVSVPLSMENPQLTNHVNVEGTKTLLRAAENSKTVKRFIFASSAAVYGNCQKLPLKESEGETIPISPYGASKLEGERLCFESYGKTGLGTTVLRYFNAYGPRSVTGGYASVINKFMERLAKMEAPIITGNGEATRDFVYVKDIARANLLAAAHDKSKGKVYNVASGKKVTMNELASLELEVMYGKNLVLPFEYKPRQQEDIVHSYADVSLIKEEIGFDASYSLEEGLSEYFRSLWSSLPLGWQQRQSPSHASRDEEAKQEEKGLSALTS